MPGELVIDRLFHLFLFFISSVLLLVNESLMGVINRSVAWWRTSGFQNASRRQKNEAVGIDKPPRLNSTQVLLRFCFYKPFKVISCTSRASAHLHWCRSLGMQVALLSWHHYCDAPLMPSRPLMKTREATGSRLRFWTFFPFNVGFNTCIIVLFSWYEAPCLRCICFMLCSVTINVC